MSGGVGSIGFTRRHAVNVAFTPQRWRLAALAAAQVCAAQVRPSAIASGLPRCSAMHCHPAHRMDRSRAPHSRSVHLHSACRSRHLVAGNRGHIDRPADRLWSFRRLSTKAIAQTSNPARPEPARNARVPRVCVLTGCLDGVRRPQVEPTGWLASSSCHARSREPGIAPRAARGRPPSSAACSRPKARSFARGRTARRRLLLGRRGLGPPQEPPGRPRMQPHSRSCRDWGCWPCCRPGGGQVGHQSGHGRARVSCACVAAVCRERPDSLARVLVVAKCAYLRPDIVTITHINNIDIEFDRDSSCSHRSDDDLERCDRLDRSIVVARCDPRIALYELTDRLPWWF